MDVLLQRPALVSQFLLNGADEYLLPGDHDATLSAMTSAATDTLDIAYAAYGAKLITAEVMDAVFQLTGGFLGEGKGDDIGGRDAFWCSSSPGQALVIQ